MHTDGACGICPIGDHPSNARGPAARGSGLIAECGRLRGIGGERNGKLAIRCALRASDPRQEREREEKFSHVR